MNVLLLTTRGQACASGSIAARLLQAGIRIEDAAQLHLCQSNHLCIARAFVLQWQLIVVQHDRVQAALETLKHPRVLPGVHETARVGVLQLRKEGSKMNAQTFKDTLKR